MLAAQPPLPDVAVYHCQQAAEKALKAVLVWHDRPFPKTHDLDLLGGLVAALEPNLAALADRAADLTPYCWRFRYPSDVFVPEDDDVAAARSVAQELLHACEAIVATAASVPAGP